jgi:hypothetical protein
MWSWSFRDLWNLNGYLREDLEQAEASAQAKWTQQHTPNGAHTDVTADTVEAETVTATSSVLLPFTDVTAPGLAFADAPETGLYSYAAGFIGVVLDGVLALSMVKSLTSGWRLYVPDAAHGTGSVNGSWVRVGRNSSGSGAAGVLILTDRGGTDYALWVEGGKLRIGSPPVESDVTFSHTGGTVVGTQS